MKPKNKRNRGQDHQEARMKNPTDPIPKKTFKTSQLLSQQGGRKSKWNQKLCQLCAQWSLHSKNSHDTGQYCKWNKDGTPKGDYRNLSYDKTKSVNVHQQDGEADV